ncbi:hypothetical protein SCHPADRAFT_1002945 [Schizopora paradoxa]|uniref:Yeast cell wall synthesis Kre9/Knh1-like N-terminal domain-containing protein n=1 Tax=Schizopora paradoxa TaxID=27342 RepID=A0A0H2R217_9AGAM|nr:hypothetical protein SCHPADRAFT_1002945 [Schizopora paradoxa]
MMFFAPLLALAAAVVVSAQTTDPAIIFPDSTYVWTSGSTGTVSWAVANIMPPTCGDDVNTAIYLAQNNAVIGEPIATNFSLVRGTFEIDPVPNVDATAQYQVALFANTSDPTDAGSFSEDFTINSA